MYPELSYPKRRSEEKAKLAAEEEIKAREDDRQDLREFLRKIQTQVSLVQLPKILIYRMEEPHGPPIELRKCPRRDVWINSQYIP